MAKRRVPPEAKGSRQYERHIVVRDEGLLSPVLADFATLANTGRNITIHSLYQTELPVSGFPPSGGSIDCVLVGRYAYPNEHFKEAVALFVRQYIELETRLERKDEAIAWLHQLLDELT